tara:strand:- start:3335 stop:3709 length:375 start_codon:yes stop_codon:yes gene_type:complete
MNPFEKIPQTELQFFKEKVSRWVNVDQQISELEKQIRELKKVRNKELEPEITNFMQTYNVKDLNTENGRLRCQEYKTKKGLNKQNIRQNLSKFLTESSQLDEAVQSIISEREIVTKYKIKKLKN